MTETRGQLLMSCFPFSFSNRDPVSDGQRSKMMITHTVCVCVCGGSYSEVNHKQTCLDDGCRKRKNKKKRHMIGEVREEIQRVYVETILTAIYSNGQTPVKS